MMRVRENNDMIHWLRSLLFGVRNTAIEAADTLEPPEFNENGSVAKTVLSTVLCNGVIVQNRVELQGPTDYIGSPKYEVYRGGAQISLQKHSHTVSYRNTWIRVIL